jgi:hypothetical protein
VGNAASETALGVNAAGGTERCAGVMTRGANAVPEDGAFVYGAPAPY